MKVLKIIAIALVSLIVLTFISALFVDGHYEVSKSILINKSSPEVFAYVSHIRNQEKYSVWLQRDPDCVKTYTGTDGVVGFTASWKSDVKQVGQGEQEIRKIIALKRIDLELRFIKPFQATDHVYMETVAQDENETKVIWGFDGEMKYPVNFFLLFINMEDVLGGDLDASLVNLKTILESKQ